MSNSWCTIESDPGVFSELIESFGVNDVAVTEVYNMDMLTRSHGLIFLFKWRQESDPRPTLEEGAVPGLFFAQQKVQNACATQAILSVLFNSEGVALGTQLQDLKDFAVGVVDPDTKGLVIGESDMIREAHNSFARPEVFVSDEDKYSKKGGKLEEAYHFISYVPYNGHVYELDGLKAGPVLLGAIPDSLGDEAWLTVARPAIESRIGRYSANETHFALMSVCEKQETVLRREIVAKQTVLASISDEAIRSSLTDDIQMLEVELAIEKQRVLKQREENVRRKHNYLQFIMTLLSALARKDKLRGMIEKAKNTASD